LKGGGPVTDEKPCRFDGFIAAINADNAGAGRSVENR
jgi:hypothetical protein